MPSTFISTTDRDCHNERSLMSDLLGTQLSNGGDLEAEAIMGEVGHAVRVPFIRSWLWRGCMRVWCAISWHAWLIMAFHSFVHSSDLKCGPT
jgi:hypothetical protein